MNQFTASLWGDEAWAATLAIKPYLQIVSIVSHDTSPPLYYLLLHIWMKFFGTSEVVIRSLSFLFFLGTVLTVYFIGKNLWDKRTAILAALLTFANPFLFTYAFEGRMYSLLALTSTLSIYFFLKKNKTGFILATTAALYTHHFSIFVVVFEGLFTLKEGLGKPLGQLIRRLTDFLLIGLLYLPWLPALYYQTSLVGSGFWLGRPTIKTLIEIMGKFLAGTGKGYLQTAALSISILILASRRWIVDKNKSLILLGWFLTPLMLTFSISYVFQPIFYDRYMLMVIPALTLLLASLRNKPSTILIVITTAVLMISNISYFLQPIKRPFRELASYIKTQAVGLPLINYNAAAHHLWESKYYGLEAPIYSPQPLPFYTGTALMAKSDVIKELPIINNLGVITSARLEEVRIPNYHVVKAQPFGSLLFLWMEKDQGF